MSPPYKLGMFGFSLTKLVFTIIAIAIVWQGFKWLGRMNERPGRGSVSGKKENKATTSDKADAKVEELVKCKTCETFVAADAKSCGKDDCPFPT